MAITATQTKYRVISSKANLDGKEITVNEHIPIFESDEERKRVKRSIESNLYAIFSKYMKSTL